MKYFYRKPSIANCLAISIVVSIFFLAANFVFFEGRINKEAEEIRREIDTARLTIDLGNGERRTFEGDTNIYGVSLADVLYSIAENNKELNIKMISEGENLECLGSIKGMKNENGCFWIFVLPEMGWARSLGNDYNLKNIMLTGGVDAELVYKQ